MPNVQILDDYRTESEVAAQLGKTQRTMQRWRRLRIGPVPTVIGANVYYHIDDVHNWLKAQRQESIDARAAG